MEIKRIVTQPSNKWPGDYFTGTVWIDPLFQIENPARIAGANVTFEPGARTAWRFSRNSNVTHSHTRTAWWQSSWLVGKSIGWTIFKSYK